MLIDSNTRIADLIKKNKDSIDAIASIAKPLEKLKNPILRKLMASRVSIAEAAKMGGCQVEDFARVLRPLGFEFQITNTQQNDQKEELPAWLNELGPENIENFDVRELLASGEDPLKQIIQRFKRTQPGNTLCIINSFIPTPLVRLLEKDGVKTYTKSIHPSEFHSYFFKPLHPSAPQLASSSEDQVFMDTPDRFNELQVLFLGNIKEIDVRHLDMPLPMQTILKELSILKKESALFVHHKRIPIYLLEELAEQRFLVHVLNLDENNVKLFIFHNEP